MLVARIKPSTLSILAIATALLLPACDRGSDSVVAAAGERTVRPATPPTPTAVTELLDAALATHADLPSYPILPKEEVAKLDGRLRAGFDGEKWDALDEEMQGLLESGAYTYEGEIAYLHAVDTVSAHNGLEDPFESWIWATESTHAYATAVDVDVNRAWAIRGSGWSSSVSQRQWQGFHHYLNQAMERARISVEKDPKNIAALNYSLRAHMGLSSEVEDITKVYEASRAAHPGNSTSLRSLSYALLPRWLGSQKVYLDLLKQEFPKTPETLGRFNTMIYLLKYTSDWKGPTAGEIKKNGLGVQKIGEAILRYEELWPGSSRLRAHFLDVLNDKNNDAAVLAFSEEGIAKFPESGFMPFARGRALVELKRWQEARPFLEQAITIDPEDWQAHGWLATAGFRQNRHAEARSSYLRALELIPENEYYFRTQYHSRLCFGGSATNDHAFAIEHGTKAIELNPGNAYGHYYRGYAYGEMGEKEKAKQDFQNAIRVDADIKASIDIDMPGWESW